MINGGGESDTKSVDGAWGPKVPRGMNARECAFMSPEVLSTANLQHDFGLRKNPLITCWGGPLVFLGVHQAPPAPRPLV